MDLIAAHVMAIEIVKVGAFWLRVDLVWSKCWRIWFGSRWLKVRSRSFKMLGTVLPKLHI